MTMPYGQKKSPHPPSLPTSTQMLPFSVYPRGLISALGGEAAQHVAGRKSYLGMSWVNPLACSIGNPAKDRRWPWPLWPWCLWQAPGMVIAAVKVPVISSAAHLADGPAGFAAVIAYARHLGFSHQVTSSIVTRSSGDTPRFHMPMNSLTLSREMLPFR